MDLQNILTELGPTFEERAPDLDAQNKFAMENFVDLKAAGAYKAIIPTDLGGGGASFTDLCHFLRELAHYCPSTALALSMHQHLAAVAVFKHLNGDDGSTATLKMVAEKDLVLVSTGGGDFLTSNGTAEKVDGGYNITCRKSFCSGAPFGNVAVMSCAYDDGKKEHVLHFSVPLNAPGVEVLDDWDAMGMKGTGSNTIAFNKVFVPDEKIGLMRDRGVWHPVWSVVATFAFPIFMAPYVGVAEAIADKTITMLSSRGNVHHGNVAALGEMHNHLRVARWAIDSIIDQANDFDFKPDVDSAANALQAKSIITENGRNSAQKAMEALGGYSYFKKVGIERLYRDLLAGEFHPLQHVKQTEAIGNHLLGNAFVA